MCRNIRTLYNFEPETTSEEVEAAALQYVRKVTGMNKPSQANEEVFERAIHEIAHLTEHLLADLVTTAQPREERQQPGSLARAEGIAQLLEIAREEACGIAVQLARFVREPLRLGTRGAHGRDERVLQLEQPVRDRLRRGPHCEHHRQARALEPHAAEVVVRRRILERGLQRRIADQQLRLRLLAERDMRRLGQQHLRQHDRRRGLRRDGDGTHVFERRLRHELDRVDRALRRHAKARQDAQPLGVPRVLDRRDRRDVELTGDDLRVQRGRNALHLLDLRVEPEEDRRHVHVRDAAEADQLRRSSTAVISASSSLRWCVPLSASAARAA